MNKLVLLSFSLLLLFGSCAKSTDSEVEIYNNDFEGGTLAGITNGVISTFSGRKVLGNYNNSQFSLGISDLPEHDLVDISFELYIHDNWDGNIQIQNSLIGPDIWEMKVDNKSYINTTFSNNECAPGNFCAPQSYPANYPNFNNNPKTGAFDTNLPGFCSQANSVTGTTVYSIHKRINHSDKNITIQCLDKLIQKNVDDPKCDESWSVDNIRVTVISLK